MAAKTPDILKVTTMGELKCLIAKFSTNDIDDNDTWDTGMTSIVSVMCQQTSEGPDDLCPDGISAGVITFSSKANNTGYVMVYGYDY